MTLELMNTNADKRYLSKSTSLIKKVTCKIKEGTSIINPTVVIEKMSASHIRKCNYAHISDFGRYYFINNIVISIHAPAKGATLFTAYIWLF